MGGVLQRVPSRSRTRQLIATWVRADAPHLLLPAVIAAASLYAVFTVLVLAGPPITGLDQYLFDLHLVPKSSPWHEPLQWWVFLGQRLPAMTIAGLYAFHRTLRTRSATPLTLYAVAAAAFMGSVGVAKYATGRVGPRFTDQAHTVWDGGNIFPSGHVTGAVVMYGVIALIAPRAHRRLLTLVAVTLSITIGLGAVALNTHWFSDVVGAWLNGSIVLAVSWAITPEAQRRAQPILAAIRHHLLRRPAPAEAEPVSLIPPR